MYLTREETKLLDEALKIFEVGFRSYIADKIILSFNTIDKYRNSVNNKKNTYKGESIILSEKIIAVLNDFSRESKINKIYRLLSETKNNCDKKEIVNIKTDKKSGGKGK